MVCAPKFPDKIPFECLVDIFEAVRGGEANAIEIGTQATWVLGSVLAKFDGRVDPEDPAITLNTYEGSLAEQVERLEPYFQPSMKAADAETIPPSVWWMLAKFLLELISERLGK